MAIDLKGVELEEVFWHISSANKAKEIVVCSIEYKRTVGEPEEFKVWFVSKEDHEAKRYKGMWSPINGNHIFMTKEELIDSL